MQQKLPTVRALLHDPNPLPPAVSAAELRKWGEMGLGEGSLLLSSGLSDQAAWIFDQKTKYNTRKSFLHHNQLKPLVI